MRDPPILTPSMRGQCQTGLPRSRGSGGGAHYRGLQKTRRFRRPAERRQQHLGLRALARRKPYLPLATTAVGLGKFIAAIARCQVVAQASSIDASFLAVAALWPLPNFSLLCRPRNAFALAIDEINLPMLLLMLSY
jgi:hypothetical protein